MLASNALTTVERVALLLDIPTKGKEKDERTIQIIELLINRTSAWIETQIGRHLGKDSYHQWYEANGQQELITLEYPIISVERIKEDGKLVDPRCYDFGQTGHIGVIYRADGWLKDGYRRGLAYDIVELKRNIEVWYTAGYVLPKDANKRNPQTLPADLEGLVWDMIAQMYATLSNGSHGLTAFSISDVSWHFDKQSNPEWQKIINLYRRY